MQIEKNREIIMGPDQTSQGGRGLDVEVMHRDLLMALDAISPILLGSSSNQKSYISVYPGYSEYSVNAEWLIAVIE